MKKFALLFMIIQAPIDVLLLLFAGISAYTLRFTDWAVELKPVLFSLTLEEFLQYVWVVIPVVLVVFAFSGLYSPKLRRRFAGDIVRICIAMLAALSLVALYILFTQTLFDSRFLILSTWILATLYIILGRLGVRAFQGFLYRLGFGLTRVVIIGSGENAKHLADQLRIRPGLGFLVVGVVSTFSATDMKKITVDEIIIADPRSNSKTSLAALAYATAHQLGFRYSADLFATLSANMQIHPLAGIPMVELKRTPLDGWGRVVKRLVDIVGSCILILLSVPFMCLSALFILFETGRPIIYKNKRVGVRRREFFTLKFRSMYQKDSTGEQFGGKKAMAKEKALIKAKNSKKGPIYKIQDDPRVTPIGKIIRRWSIDEIPQFVNVLVGDMSLVGPRPHQPREVEGFGKEHELVFHIKPGITGLSQISGRSDLPYEEEMRLDVLYMERWSLWLDLIILLKTPFVIFKKRNVI